MGSLVKETLKFGFQSASEAKRGIVFVYKISNGIHSRMRVVGIAPLIQAIRA